MLSGSSDDSSQTKDEMKDGFVWQRSGQKVQRDWFFTFFISHIFLPFFSPLVFTFNKEHVGMALFKENRIFVVAGVEMNYAPSPTVLNKNYFFSFEDPQIKLLQMISL